MPQNGKAYFVKQHNGQGDGRVYRLDPPLHGSRFDEGVGDYVKVPYEHVWVSAAVVPWSGPETYVFGCTPEGTVLDWVELDGSFRGGLDHVRALRDAGYEVVSA